MCGGVVRGADDDCSEGEGEEGIGTGGLFECGTVIFRGREEKESGEEEGGGDEEEEEVEEEEDDDDDEGTN